MRKLLAPLSLIYALVVAVRNALFARGIIKRAQAGAPVISIGNITTGGTGKTPCAIAVIELLLRNGLHPALVSRGYGRATTGLHVVSTGMGTFASARDAGDEPLLIARRFPQMPVVVAEQRIDAARKAVSMGADCIVADDSFQHRYLARNVDIVMAGDELAGGSHRLLPAGNAREPLGALRRASIVISLSSDEERTRRTLAAHSRAALFFADMAAVDVIDPRTGATHPPASLEGTRVFVVTGIARPERVLLTVTQLGAVIVDAQAFDDHHWFSDDEIAAMVARARAQNAILLTTEKDWVRVAESRDSSVVFAETDVRVLRVALQIRHDAAAFEKLVMMQLRGEILC